ncbi:MAG TPA: glutamine-hydrolyzing GMP synthase, partial [Acidobacteriota bacterium]|nr:glutamine-hydrolyzing GMP synthase [Acidobacteriota bacterium]
MSFAERESILILDFGSQYTQLIARRIREAGVYSEIVPFNVPYEEVVRRHPVGIVLSGGPSSVFAEGAPRADSRVLEFSGPILGICYGMQWMIQTLGGDVRPSSQREYGRTEVEVVEGSELFRDIPRQTVVWMSHGDRIERLPDGFRVVARSTTTVAAVEHNEKRRYGIQFHPE